MIDLDIPQKPVFKTKKFKLNAEVAALLDDYVQAAKDSRDDITRDEVVEVILLKHIKRDKKFKEWQKEQKS